MADMVIPIEPGTVLGGKFLVERVLGRGGMGVVVAARHLQLDELVAIKFLLPEATTNPEAVARFDREARAAVKIKSEHVARVSDVGVLEWGAPYMVMEYLHGRDLGQVLELDGPLPLETAVDYALQACEAVAEAHSLGIVHRDLKPSNLFLIQRADGSPCIKVLDFGISKVTALSGSDADADMTRTMSVMGSPHYMSPEQLASARNVDVRTDVWAFGVILFELLSGRHPFQGETLPQLCVSIMNSPPASLVELRPELPAAVQRLIHECLEKDRNQRVPNIGEFANRLAEFAAKHSRLSIERITRVTQSARPPMNTQVRSPPAPRAGRFGTVAELGRTTPKPPTSTPPPAGKRWIAFVAGVVTALIALAIFVVRQPAPTVPEAAADGASSASGVAASVIGGEGTPLDPPAPELPGAPGAEPRRAAAPVAPNSAPRASASTAIENQKPVSRRPEPRAVPAPVKKPSAPTPPPQAWGGRL